MTLQIRLMKKEDIPLLAKVYVYVYKQLSIGENWTIPAAKRLLNYWFTKQPDLAFVALINKKPIGAFVAGLKPWWDGNHLNDGEIFVHPQFQKQGIGTTLSKALYTNALQKYKVVSFDAFTFKKSSFPLQWYLAQGFTISKDLVIITGNVRKILSRLQNPKS